MKTEKKHTPCGPYEALVKRPLDLVTSGLALIFLSPVMVLVALGVRIKLGSPVIFSQARPGLNGKVFSIYKFQIGRASCRERV